MAMPLNYQLPFKVRIKSFWANEQLTVEEINNFVPNKEQLKDFQSRVIIPEYKNFSIEFKVVAEAEDAVLKIEDVGRVERKLELKPAQEQQLYGAKQEEKFPWTPDDYLLTVEHQGQEYYAKFKVNPKNMSSYQMTRLRKVVNNLLKGLVFDIKYERKGRLKGGFFADFDIYLLDIIEKNLEMIIRCSTEIINSPILSVGKNYQERSERFVLDKKALQWLGSPKGQAKNSSLRQPNTLYQRRVQRSIDNPENKWFIKIIDFINLRLKELERKLESQKQAKEDLCVEINKRRERLKKELSEIEQRSDSYKFKSELIRIKGMLKGSREELKNYHESLAVVDNNLQRVKRLLRYFSFVMESELYFKNTDFRQIKKPSNKLFKEPRYRALYDLYQQILNCNQDSFSLDSKSYQFKDSDKLYEYYVLINTIKALEDLGFKWQEDWLKDKLKQEALLTEIPKGTVIKFENEDCYLEMCYEEEIEVYSESKIQTSQSRFLASKNWRPDLRLDIYTKNKEYLRSFIIEIKYSKFRLLYDNDFKTEVSAQLRKYKTDIEYLTATGELKENPIDKVLITYPQEWGSEEAVKRRYRGRFIFIQLSPAKDELEEQYGYAEFKKELGEIIFK
ncbi:hypothetical protein [Fuchsiella alkaliacetigena]|uniref:hypothetical protein n=1 Tax=Fuchsiella alkaliacetigena TaxID=957042 RepID=UPI00200AD84A|nr:hypothetical protein [Fuchsiella alkaliacetigena]MCK8825424.1 hypothetical protein [Fuchsiella alkaliacetigena]